MRETSNSFTFLANTISYLEVSFLTAQAWRNERLSKVPLQDRYWLVWKTIQMTGSKIPRSSLIIHLKAGHARLNWKSAISRLQIGSFQGRSFHDRWSRETKTLGMRVLPTTKGSILSLRTGLCYCVNQTCQIYTALIIVILQLLRWQEHVSGALW